MGYILFNDKKKPVEAQAKKLNRNQIEITGCKINTSGFSYYQDAEMKRKYGDFNDFKTLYREMDESYILSNNGSVYPEPSNPEEKEPTVRELVESLQVEMENVEEGLAENTMGIEDTQIALCEFDEDIQTRVADLELAICELDMLINGGE